MPPPALTARDVNRATLARQHLLTRSTDPVPRVVAHLVGLQAQAAPSPFVALWSRVHDLARGDVAGGLEDRTLVKGTLMRGTLHVTTAADYPWLRRTLQPVLTDALESVARNRGGVPEVAALVAAARDLLQEGPQRFADITALLTRLHPDGDPGIMRYAVRTHLPMVQVPTGTPWSFPGNPSWTSAREWLGDAVDAADADPSALVRRYLAALGPATVADVTTWSYLPGLAGVVDGMRDELVVHHDEAGGELLDLPGAPLPGGDADAPPRLLPEFDTLLLSHKDRTRFVPEEHRRAVFLPGLRVAATLLVDGLVAGTWSVERRGRASAALTVTPFAPLPATVRRAVTEEAERLVRFLAPEAGEVAARVAT